MDSDLDADELEALDRAEREYSDWQGASHKRGNSLGGSSNLLIGVQHAPCNGQPGSFESPSCVPAQAGHCGIKRNRSVGHHFRVQGMSSADPLAHPTNVSNAYQHVSGGMMHTPGHSGSHQSPANWVGSDQSGRGNPYSGPPQQIDMNAGPTASFGNSFSNSSRQLSGNQASNHTPAKPCVKVLYTATMELASGGRFVVKMSGYHGELVNLMKSIPGGTMGKYSKGTSFDGERYKAIVEALHAANESLQAVQLKIIELGSIPQKIMLAATKLHDDSDRYCTLPPKLTSTLHQFQIEGVQFCLKNGGRLLIGDEMGLGKTVQALAISQCYADKWPVLVVTSSSLRDQWAGEITEWLDVPRDKIDFMQSSKPPEPSGIAFVIASYENVSKVVDKIKGMFEILILDESHMIKTPTSARSRACVALAQKCSHVVLLSGTPATSRPFELYAQIKAVLPGANLTQKEFSDQYCAGDYYSKHKGSRNEEELNLLLSSTIMVRRLKKNVLAQLGSKLRQQVYISLSQEKRNALKSIKRRLDDVGAIDDPLGLMQTSQAMIENHKKRILNELFHESAKAKIPPVQDYISNLINNNQQKLLVFGHHKEMLDGIEQVLNRRNVSYIRIDGSTQTSRREEYKTRFQNDNTVRVAILAIKAAGVGLNFTAAHLVLFAELSWVPGEIKQCEDRAHRIGQKHTVSVRFLLAKDSIDDIIWRTIQNKLENVGQVLDGDQETLQVGKKCVVQDPSQSNLDRYLTPSQDGVAHDTSSHKRPPAPFNRSGSKRNKSESVINLTQDH